MSLVTEYLRRTRRALPGATYYDPSVSSLEEAGAVHVDADHVLKAVVNATRGGRAVAVIPASRRLDMHLVREALADPQAYLATEGELQSEYPSIELGGAPALGWLLDAETLVDPLRARTRHGRVRRRHPDGVRSGPDAQSLPRRTRRLRSHRGRTGIGRVERTMNGGQPHPIRRIVVGVDGSDGAARAVMWSARLAQATSAEVVADALNRESGLPGRVPLRLRDDPDRVGGRRIEGMARAHTRVARPAVAPAAGRCACPVPGRARSRRAEGADRVRGFRRGRRDRGRETRPRRIR